MTMRIRFRISAVLGAAAVLGLDVSCAPETPVHPKMVVIGFDGMDPILCERLMDAGELPNLSRMRRAGGYRRLGTSIPPQSPVAWASFITGANPGVHGIFDFIHRDPSKQCMPYYAAAETRTSTDGWEVGEHRIPLTFWPFNHEAPRTELRRGGTPFWDYLEDAGVSVRIYDIPANYPPSRSRHGHMCCLAGMGVPDLMGTYGTYQFFSEDQMLTKSESGGMRIPLIFRDNHTSADLTGPDNPYLKKPKPARIPFEIYRHPSEPWARIEVQGQTVVLKEREWSDWQKLEFTITMPPFLPGEAVSGICRFYLQQVRPSFRLYVTPINIDPSDPGDQRVTEPPDFITDISDELGLFYTSGFQEDHKALSNKVFADDEYYEQANYVLDERMELLDYALEHYRNGVLFFYFSSTDLQAHMFWWDSDEPHPTRTREQAKRYHNVIVELYRRMDAVVGNVMRRVGSDATYLVMSDHGFGNFRRQFNANTWLRDNGYLYPPNCKSILDPRDVDWTRTRAYALGLNGLYVNLRGRERDGTVPPEQREALLVEIKEKLLGVRDLSTGQKVFGSVYRREDVYRGPNVNTAPDLILGYNRGYRTSWASTLGTIRDDVFSDNRSAWSADHCIAAEQVPGVVFSNRPIPYVAPSLIDLAPTILNAYGIPTPPTMEGRDLFEPTETARRNADLRESP